MPHEVIHATRRLLTISAGNLKNSHIYIRKPLDFFPPDCFGPPRRDSKTVRNGIEIILDGMNEVIETDICVDAKTGKPRFLRDRAAVRRFFKHHRIVAKLR
jgi:hypothetical protein